MTRRHPQVPTVRTRLSACDRSWFAPPRSPWPAPFPPPSPPVPWSDPCSKASAVLRSCPTPCTRTLRSGPLGAPYGPGDSSSGQMQGLPGSVHSVSAHARGLRPRRVRLRLARAASTVWPSACSERVGTQDWPISGLNTLPARSPVNASSLSLPRWTHDSGLRGFPGFPPAGLPSSGERVSA